ncbi:MAG: metalloregulator ArsR/SmtB family transcription factor [Planctomycetia bacterium]|nr:metalloregulator ArsR/SmtB family transcription factor [Planctomycetia bacterium]
MQNNKEEICEDTFIDEKKVSSVREKMKSETIMQLLSETFGVLGDPTRIKIIFALSQEELCVCEITDLLGKTKYAVSYHLRILRNMRLVKYRKDGRLMFYALDDEHIKNLFDEGVKHVEEF